MAFDLYALETTTDVGDGSTESDEDTVTESQEDDQQLDQQSTVPRSELAKVNAEAKKYRLERNELRKRVEELEGLSKTELERERERAATAEQNLQDLQARHLIARAANLALDAGVSRDAARDAAVLLDWEGIEDTADDDQSVAAFQELVKDKPYLAGRRGSADGGAGSRGSAEPQDMNAMIRRAAGR